LTIFDHLNGFGTTTHTFRIEPSEFRYTERNELRRRIFYDLRNHVHNLNVRSIRVPFYTRLGSISRCFQKGTRQRDQWTIFADIPEETSVHLFTKLIVMVFASVNQSQSDCVYCVAYKIICTHVCIYFIPFPRSRL